MATRVAAVAEVFPFEALNGTTASFAQGSSDRLLFAGTAWANFGSTPVIGSLKYGGSGGTDITPGGATTNFLPGANGSATAGSVLPGPSGSTTIYAAATLALEGCVAGVAYEGVGSVADFTSNNGLVGDVTTTVGSITVPNCVIGQTVSAIVFAASTNLTILDFQEIAGTTLVATDAGAVGEAFLAVCVLEKVASSNGDCVLTVTCRGTGTDTIGWAAKALRLIDAGAPPAPPPPSKLLLLGVG